MRFILLFLVMFVSGEMLAQQRVSKREKKIDKYIFKTRYKPSPYSRDTNFIVLKDTVFSDSIRLIIHNDSKNYSNIFKSGLISCQMIYKYHGPNLENIPGIIFDVQTGKEVRDSIIWFVPRDMKELRYVKTPKYCRRFKFKVTPYDFYFELRNDKVKRNSSLKIFLKNAELTWFTKGTIQEI